MNRAKRPQTPLHAPEACHTTRNPVPPARHHSSAASAPVRANFTLDALVLATAALVALGMIGQGDAGMAVLWVLLAGWKPF